MPPDHDSVKTRDAQFALATGRSVQAQRERRGMSRGELAALLGVTPDAIAKKERADREFSAPELMFLALVWHMPLDELAFGPAGRPVIIERREVVFDPPPPPARLHAAPGKKALTRDVAAQGKKTRH